MFLLVLWFAFLWPQRSVGIYDSSVLSFRFSLPLSISFIHTRVRVSYMIACLCVSLAQQGSKAPEEKVTQPSASERIKRTSSWWKNDPGENHPFPPQCIFSFLAFAESTFSINLYSSQEAEQRQSDQGGHYKTFLFMQASWVIKT